MSFGSWNSTSRAGTVRPREAVWLNWNTVGTCEDRPPRSDDSKAKIIKVNETDYVRLQHSFAQIERGIGLECSTYWSIHGQHRSKKITNGQGAFTNAPISKRKDSGVGHSLRGRGPNYRPLGLQCSLTKKFREALGLMAGILSPGIMGLNLRGKIWRNHKNIERWNKSTQIHRWELGRISGTYAPDMWVVNGAN